MNIIIVGCGKVGRSIAEQLNKEKHNITIIDTSPEVIDSVTTALDVIGVVGNGGNYNVQLEAGVEHVDLLIAVTSSDELNMVCCLIAKKASNCQTIARVRNPEFFDSIGYIKDELGLSMSINPEKEAAVEISRLIKFPSAIEIDSFAKGRVELLKFRISDDSILDGVRLSELSAKINVAVLICGVERDNEAIIPSGRFILKAKDCVTFIASPKKALEFFNHIGIKTNHIKNTMIVGGGMITYYLADILLKSGIGVTIVEKDHIRCEELSTELPEALIINGDGTDHTLLLEEGIDYTESFAAMTNIDEENVMLSLYAAKHSKAKLITKINRDALEEIVNGFDIGSIINPKNITVEKILRYVRAMQSASGSNVEALYKIIDNKAEALSFTVKGTSEVVGIPLAELKLKENLLICCIIRNGQIITPSGRDEIRVRDSVIIVTTCEGLQNLEDILR